ncbi:hypothetical protein GUA87_15640 [Sneathiella sp. P13V-1]|uniref:VPLPA-CTERM sorting domain-containing protein n=1 Tax=Sneathiella sp. P13V-1 TaxID=2697366 RepID=UPI00187B855D|nr:VPLPA-CTERM sorting domain-containing protein [Sneathiella sp. P13V-1]MBE7638290.1 hypothetical protein [Sneathiella sp. P13V-1]
MRIFVLLLASLLFTSTANAATFSFDFSNPDSCQFLEIPKGCIADEGDEFLPFTLEGSPKGLTHVFDLSKEHGLHVFYLHWLQPKERGFKEDDNFSFVFFEPVVLNSVELVKWDANGATDETITLTSAANPVIFLNWSYIITLFTVPFSDFGYSIVSMDVTTPSAVPLPAALPLYAAGVGLLGFMGWRRRRQSS